MSEPINVALAVDALGPRLTGIGRYCLELVRGLPRHRDLGALHCFVGNDWLDDPEARLAEGWQLPRRSRWRRRLDGWRRRRMLNGALVHGPNYFLPDWAERGVITVHDLSVLLYPETHPAERVRDFERRLQPSLDRAAAIITDSRSVRQEIITHLGVRPDLVHAIALGVEVSDLAPGALAGLGLTAGAYCLCVSTFEPRKRIDRLVAAYARLPVAQRAAVPLVLAGAGGWRNEALNAAIARAQAQGWLRRLDFVDEAVLAALYAGARLFVYPSRYEGFGLPPVEAMAHGVPTMVGDAACLIEVTRGAARVVDPDDETGFANALADALEDRQWQAAAGTAGRQVAATYRWADTIDATVQVYRTAAQA
jgi:alpha-1,3-rhamnosyl/mannosyltransferase